MLTNMLAKNIDSHHKIKGNQNITVAAAAAAATGAKNPLGDLNKGQKDSSGFSVFDLVNITIYNRVNTPLTLFNNKGLKLTPGRDTVFLIHGESSDLLNYVNDFFNTTTAALLTEGDYDVITVNWTQLMQPGNDTQTIRNNIANAGSVGVTVGKMINSLREKAGTPFNVSIIAHDMGTVVITTAIMAAEKNVEFIYGINQRYFNDTLLGYLYLREDMGKMVQTLSTNGFPFSFAHRDFFPNGGKVEPLKGECAFCKSYRMFADDIKAKGTKYISTVCPTFEQYVEKACDGFPKASFWNKLSIMDGPIGRYYTQI